MALFKRLPSLRWSPPRDQQIVPADAQTQSPGFSDDFKTLEDELMPHFRELDAEALRVQNQFRLNQVTLIFGGALATILGALHASFGEVLAVWAGIIESVLAAALSAVAIAPLSSNSIHDPQPLSQERSLDPESSPAKKGKTSDG